MSKKTDPMSLSAEERRLHDEDCERRALAADEARKEYTRNPPTMDELVEEVVSILRSRETDARTRLDQRFPKGHRARAAALYLHRKVEDDLCESPQRGGTLRTIEHGLHARWPGIPPGDIKEAVAEAQNRGLIGVERAAFKHSFGGPPVTEDVYRIAEGRQLTEAAQVVNEQLGGGAIPKPVDSLLGLLRDSPDEQVALSELPASLCNPDVLTYADAHDLIEFGRRNHCYTGPTNELRLESGWEWTHVTGPQRKPMSCILAENEQTPAELRLHIRLTAKGRTRAAELHLASAHPLDPKCSEPVLADDETIDAVRKVIPDWDGKNWSAVRALLHERHYTDDALFRMTVFDIRMAVCLSLLTLDRGVETTTATVVSFGAKPPGRWLRVGDNVADSATAETPSESQQLDAARLETQTPQLDTENGQWIKNKLAASLEGVETRTLADYRQDGIANSDNSFGRDRDGRVWRRRGTAGSHPWYLRSTLKSEQSKPKKP